MVLQSATVAKEKGLQDTSSATWAVQDAQILSWILGSMEPQILLHLRPYKTAKEIWQYFRSVYYQDNSACNFQLELDISHLSQGLLSIQDYYSQFMSLWADYSEIILVDVSTAAHAALQTAHLNRKCSQFLMKLWPEYEAVRSSLLNRSPLPSSEVCFGELCEEQRLATQTNLQDAGSPLVSMAYAAHGKPRTRDFSMAQCYSCKQFGCIAPSMSQ